MVLHKVPSIGHKKNPGFYGSFLMKLPLDYAILLSKNFGTLSAVIWGARLSLVCVKSAASTSFDTEQL